MVPGQARQRRWPGNARVRSARILARETTPIDVNNAEFLKAVGISDIKEETTQLLTSVRGTTPVAANAGHMGYMLRNNEQASSPIQVAEEEDVIQKINVGMPLQMYTHFYLGLYLFGELFFCRNQLSQGFFEKYHI